jgi:hypothetical protein
MPVFPPMISTGNFVAEIEGRTHELRPIMPETNCDLGVRRDRRLRKSLGSHYQTFVDQIMREPERLTQHVRKVTRAPSGFHHAVMYTEPHWQA